LPGNVYHLTHRCHDRQFLLRFAIHRDAYREELRQAVHEFDLSLLDYSITSNHVHLLAFAAEEGQISGFVKKADGEYAQDYNRLKHRSGAFWEGRFHSTMVDTGEYLFRCIQYIELNMVRCGVVRHPAEWRWSGYAELMGLRRRWRLLDVERVLSLLGTDDLTSFRNNLNNGLAEAIQKDQLRREPCWTESVAVGSESYIREIENRINRRRTELLQDGSTWALREVAEQTDRGTRPENALDRESAGENCVLGPFQRPFFA
jgi:putative transposase